MTAQGNALGAGEQRSLGSPERATYENRALDVISPFQGWEIGVRPYTQGDALGYRITPPLGLKRQQQKRPVSTRLQRDRSPARHLPGGSVCAPGAMTLSFYLRTCFKQRRPVQC